MEHHPYSAGNWMVIPNAPTQNPASAMTVAAQDYSQHHQQQQHQQHHHQSLASHFHLLHLVESLAEVTENGTRDMHSDALVKDLTSHFESCQQLLNSISESIKTKAMTVDGQKHKLEESEQLLNQRRDLIAKYRSSIEDLVKSDCNK
eukprot:TRINITY_DN5935_c0_g1_i2.p1 TRINITY_DN5935_c0_g1~~TRINITY_DN5935_c0_g1_i2.p1  ORF type:complete len:147 (+),score=38.54 TRINITY_DN5935_c0_g1_i2:374-814(+)